MIEGIIFDMDGVISDTQKIHAKVESEIFERYGISLTPEEITKKYAGVRLREFFGEVLEGKNYNLDELINEKRTRMRDLASISVDPIKGSQELIKGLFDRGIPIAVASASTQEYVKIVLDKLDVTQYFTAIIGGDMVQNGKPHPESFLRAADEIKIPYRNCLVIEDGIPGMQAAKKAGMRCIGLVESKERGYPTQNLVNCLTEITPDFIDNLK